MSAVGPNLPGAPVVVSDAGVQPGVEITLRSSPDIPVKSLGLAV